MMSFRLHLPLCFCDFSHACFRRLKRSLLLSDQRHRSLHGGAYVAILKRPFAPSKRHDDSIFPQTTTSVHVSKADAGRESSESASQPHQSRPLLETSSASGAAANDLQMPDPDKDGCIELNGQNFWPILKRLPEVSRAFTMQLLEARFILFTVWLFLWLSYLFLASSHGPSAPSSSSWATEQDLHSYMGMMTCACTM